MDIMSWHDLRYDIYIYVTIDTYTKTLVHIDKAVFGGCHDFHRFGAPKLIWKHCTNISETIWDNQSVTSIARPQPGASFSCYQCSGITAQWRLGGNGVDVLLDMFFCFCGLHKKLILKTTHPFLCFMGSNGCFFEQLELLFVSLQLGWKVMGCEKTLDWASSCWQNQPPNPLAW